MAITEPNAIRDAFPGRVLRGSGSVTYHVRDLLGEGGQGWVFRAHWQSPEGALVIVKLLRPDVVTDDSLVRFQREAEVLRKLSQQANPCPNVVRFFDHARVDVASSDGKRTLSLPFTVLEYVQGTNLERVLANQNKRGLSLDRVRRILRHSVTALESVHAQGVVHRDFKPSNILLAGEGKNEIAKVTDFGLAKVIATDLGRTKKVAGASIGYAPPEQYERGNARISPRSDVFSLGAVLFEMLAGVPAYPFSTGENPLVVLTRILQDARPSLLQTSGTLSGHLAKKQGTLATLDALLQKALDPDPDKRFATPTELWNSVDLLLEAAAEPAETSLGGSPAIVRMSPLASAPVSIRKESTSLMPSRGASRTWRWSIALPPGYAAGPAPASTYHAGVFANDGERAYGLSRKGLHWFSPGAIGIVALPRELESAQLHGLIALESGDLLVFGGEHVARIDPTGETPPEMYAPLPKGVSVFGGCALGDHVYLAGSSREDGAMDPCGAIVHFWERSLLGIQRTGSGPLRACATLNGDSTYACGDDGAFVLFQGQASTILETNVDARLSAISCSDSGIFAVGEGGHILRVSGENTASLEAAGTQQDLTCISHDTDGRVWVGAGEGRVLQYVMGHGFPRANRGITHGASVLAVWSEGNSVRALTSDGAILLGALTA